MLFSLRVAAKIKRRRGLAPDSPSGEGTATCRLGVVFPFRIGLRYIELHCFVTL